jgi:hypothetical protein
MTPKVSIIILNWNQPKFTVNCVKSVLKQTYQDFEILLVDNGSEDDSVEIFKKKFKENEKIRILETGKNLGYTGGNNFGAEHAKGEFVVVLNNDTKVEKNWLEELVNAIESEANIASVMSHVIEGDKKDIKLKNRFWTMNFIGRAVLFNLKKQEKYPPTFYPSGCSFIYKNSILDQLFDPDYFIYAEDTYLGWLLRLKGYQIKSAPKSIVHHYHNIVKKSDINIRRYFTFLGERNKILNLLIFYEIRTLIRIFPLILGHILFFNLFEPKKIPSRFKSYFWLFFHPKFIYQKRKKIQQQRKVPDKEIVKYMSYKFFEEERIKNKKMKKLLNLINKLIYFYFLVLGIRTIEFERKFP